MQNFNTSDNNGPTIENSLKILFSALDPDQKLLLKEEDIIHELKTNQDDDENQDIEDRGVYSLIRQKLGSDAIDQINGKIFENDEDNDLYSLVKSLYKNKQILEPNIMDHIHEAPDWFVGKTFKFNDPSLDQSAICEIESCEFYNEKNQKFVKFFLQNKSIFSIEYKEKDVLNVSTSFIEKQILFSFIKKYIGKEGHTWENVKFCRIREEFVEDDLKIEQGYYKMILSGPVKKGWANKYINRDKDVISTQKLELISLKDNDVKKYTFLINSNERGAREFFVKQGKKKINKSQFEFKSLSCYITTTPNKINFSNYNGKIKDLITVKELVSEANLENKKRKAIEELKDKILEFLRAEENQTYLMELIDILSKNNLKFAGQVIDEKLKVYFDPLMKLFEEMKIEDTREKVLQETAIEALYSKLVNKSKKLFIFRIMNLLGESFTHTDSVKGKDVAIFWGSTGSGKSSSINYFLGHE